MVSSQPGYAVPKRDSFGSVHPGPDQDRPVDRQELAEVLDLVFRVGLSLAEAGAAAFRVRGTMRRIASALGVEELDVVVTADSIAATVLSDQRFRTRVQRISHLGVDMRRVSELEMYSRQLVERGGVGWRSKMAWLDGSVDALLAQPRPYPLWLTGPLLGASCAAFCGAMEGSPLQMLAAFLGTYGGHQLRLWHIRHHTPVPALVITCAFASALVSWVAAHALGYGAGYLHLPASAAAPGKAVIASVLYLIPGVPLVNTLMDLLHSDLNAGLGRGAFASMVLVCIAAGVLAFLTLTGLPFR